MTIAASLASLSRTRWLLAVLLVTGAALFAAFDVAEVFHRIEASRSSLAALAVVIALVHVAAAGVARVRQEAQCESDNPDLVRW